MSEACEKCGADISFQSEWHPNCEEVSRLRRIIKGEIAQLRQWAIESRQGGWSTHQVDPMRRRADYLEEILRT